MFSVKIGEIEGQGPILWGFQKVMGCSIAFQASRNPRVSAEMIPGTPSGIPMFQKRCQWLAPSIAADSNTSLGIASKPRSIMKTGKVEKIPGKMTAQGYPIDRIDVEPDNWEPL